MKKLLGILVLGLFVSGCGTGLTNTTASNMDKGAAKIGMTKEEFCFEFNTLKFKQDPCKAPIFSSLSETLGLYYPDTKMEIAHDSRAEVFFVFENTTDKDMVGQVIPSVSPGRGAEFFHKTECFCFERQTLLAGEKIELPVIFIVDTALPLDIGSLSLGYTLFDVTKLLSEQQKVASL